MQRRSPQPLKNPSSEQTTKWEFGDMATGTSGAYIHYGSELNGRIRSKPHKSLNPHDVVQALQTGVPVMYWKPDERCFDDFVMKLDSRQTFLFLFKSPKDGRFLNNVNAYRVADIEKKVGGDKAFQWSQAHGVRDPGLDARTIVAIQTGPSDTDTPPQEKLIYVMTPPEMRLLEMLELAIPEHRLQDADATGLEPTTPGSRKARAGLATTKVATAKGAHPEDPGEGGMDLYWSLEGVRFRELGTIFDEDPRATVDLSLRLLSERFMPLRSVHRLQVIIGEHIGDAQESDLVEAVCDELSRLQLMIGHFRAIDRQRMRLTIHEMALFTKFSISTSQDWIDPCLYEFVSNVRYRNIPRPSKSDDFDCLREAIPVESPMVDQTDQMARNILQGALVALRQMLEFEGIHHEVMHGMGGTSIPVLKSNATLRSKPLTIPEDVPVEEPPPRPKTHLRLTISDFAADKAIEGMFVTCEFPPETSTKKRLDAQGACFVGDVPPDGGDLLVTVWAPGVGGIDNKLGSAKLESLKVRGGTEGQLNLGAMNGESWGECKYRIDLREYTEEQVMCMTFSDRADVLLEQLQPPGAVAHEADGPLAEQRGDAAAPPAAVPPPRKPPPAMAMKRFTPKLRR